MGAVHLPSNNPCLGNLLIFQAQFPVLYLSELSCKDSSILVKTSLQSEDTSVEKVSTSHFADCKYSRPRRQNARWHNYKMAMHDATCTSCKRLEEQKRRQGRSLGHELNTHSRKMKFQIQLHRHAYICLFIHLKYGWLCW